MFGKKRKTSLSEGEQVYLENAVKTLAANIRFTSVDNPLRVIGVTSSVPNEGKTTVSYMLGQAMAAGGGNVLLVDCDLRHRSLAKKAQVHPREGLYNVLAGRCELADAVIALETPGLYLLDVEPQIPNPVDVLASKRFHDLMLRVRKEYSFVIVDTPPLSAFVDAAVASQNTDGMLLVVREGMTKREDLLAAYDQLCKADARVVGTVLNFCSSERKGHYYYNYYTADGKKVRSHGAGARKREQQLAAPEIPEVRWDVYAGEADETNILPTMPEAGAHARGAAKVHPAALGSSLSAEHVSERGDEAAARPASVSEGSTGELELASGSDQERKPKAKGKSKDKGKSKGKDKDKAKNKREDKAPKPETDVAVVAAHSAVKVPRSIPDPAVDSAAEPGPAPAPVCSPKKSIDDTMAFLVQVGYGPNSAAGK